MDISANSLIEATTDGDGIDLRICHSCFCDLSGPIDITVGGNGPITGTGNDGVDLRVCDGGGWCGVDDLAIDVAGNTGDITSDVDPAVHLEVCTGSFVDGCSANSALSIRNNTGAITSGDTNSIEVTVGPDGTNSLNVTGNSAVNGAGTDGVDASGESLDLTVTGNTLMNNGEDGIDLDGDAPLPATSSATTWRPASARSPTSPRTSTFRATGGGTLPAPLTPTTPAAAAMRFKTPGMTAPGTGLDPWVDTITGSADAATEGSPSARKLPVFGRRRHGVPGRGRRAVRGDHGQRHG